MAAFQFPDPAVQQTVVNPITGSTYQWKEPPGKWVITADTVEVSEIIWEGDHPPLPIGDYKLWYSTDTLELYFYYCDAAGSCAWLPTAVPLTAVDGLRSDLNIALSMAQRADSQAQANTAVLTALDTSLTELETEIGDVNLEDVLTNGNYADKEIFLTDGSDTLIEISPTEDLIGIASDLGSVNPRFRMTHIDKLGYPDAHVQWELADNGTNSNFQFNEHVTDVNFTFDDQKKLILNKDEGALFTDAVKVGSTEALAFMAVKDNDVATKKYVDAAVFEEVSSLIQTEVRASADLEWKVLTNVDSGDPPEGFAFASGDNFQNIGTFRFNLKPFNRASLPFSGAVPDNEVIMYQRTGTSSTHSSMLLSCYLYVSTSSSPKWKWIGTAEVEKVVLAEKHLRVVLRSSSFKWGSAAMTPSLGYRFNLSSLF